MEVSRHQSELALMNMASSVCPQAALPLSSRPPDRTFLEALHYFCVHTITWRALPHASGNWNSIWKRFW